MYNYVVTAQKPTITNFAVVGNFCGPNESNLILARCNRIEILSISPEGLKGVLETPIYGRVAALQLFRPPTAKRDLLLLLTHRYKLCVLEYDPVAGEVRTRASGDVSSRIGRPADSGMLAVVDPDCRVIGLHLYDGLLKVIPIGEGGDLLEAFDIRLEELQVKDVRFLHGRPRPTVAILYEDARELRHVRTYEINIRDKELSEGPWTAPHLDMGANLVVPLPAPVGGALVLGENVLSYVNAGHPNVAIPLPHSAVIRACGAVDPDGSRFFLSDHLGDLYVLGVSHEGGRVTGMRLETIGQTSPAECLAYLDNGVVFVGSSFADSQLIRVRPEPVAQSDNVGQPPSYVEVLDTWSHVGPIQDFTVVDLERQGQGQIVTCSGIHQHGSLRVIRSGIGINEQAALPLEGIKGVWSLRPSSSSEFDRFLVVSFVGETRVLAMTAEAELDEVEGGGGVEGGRQTLLCANVGGDMAVQVTPSSVRLLRLPSLSLAAEWRPRGGVEITVAAASPSQVLVASRGGHVTLLRVGGEGALTEQATRTLSAEVSCLDLHPLTPEEAGRGEAALAAAGLWDCRVVLLSLPSLEERGGEGVGGEGGVLPRSCMLVTFDGGHTVLMAALGDGQLCTFSLDPATCRLTNPKKATLGTKPVLLRRFCLGPSVHVFAASDRPAVVYSAKNKLLFSSVNTEEVLYMAPFHCEGFPNCLALVKGAELSIGSIDEIQKLHVRTVKLGEQPRRIAYHEASQTFAVCTVEYKPAGTTQGGNENQVCWVRLIDAATLDTLDKFQLGEHEEPCSITCVQLDEPTAPQAAQPGGASGVGAAAAPRPLLYAVGTAYVLPDQDEPQKGRVLLLQVQDGRLVYSGGRDTKGAVWSLEAFQGRLLAAVNHRVYLFKSSHSADDGTYDLHSDTSYQGHTLSLYLAARGDSVLVGDLMKSMALLQYRTEEGAFEERARDYNPQWMSALHFLDDDTYIGAENSYNLFVLRRNGEAANDEERSRLEVVGEFGLGYFVNRFRPGSIVMRPPDADSPTGPTLLFGTVEGAIGLVVPLTKEQFDLLDKLQRAMQQDAPGVGNLLHEDYRQFAGDTASARDARGFVDGDLVECFLDLRRARQDELIARIGGAGGAVYADVVRLLEELARLH